MPKTLAFARELASAAIRLSDKHDVTPLVRAVMAHKEDTKDPIIPQLVWLAYEKIISKKEGAVRPPRRNSRGSRKKPPRTSLSASRLSRR